MIAFYIKKIISFFIEPFGLTFTMFFLGTIFLYLKKIKFAKFFLTGSFIFLFLFSYPPFSNYLITQLENKYPKYQTTKNIKYIHVLGNGHNTDPSQPISSHLSCSGTKRVLEGVILHKQIKNSILIFTGYEGSTNVANAIMNKQLALSLGVKEKNIITNPKPKDTKEEALFIKSILKPDEKFIIVTSATHMPRAIQIFHSLSLHPIPAPTDFYKEEITTYLKAPNIYSLFKSQLAMHEYFGLLWERLKS